MLGSNKFWFSEMNELGMFKFQAGAKNPSEHCMNFFYGFYHECDYNQSYCLFAYGGSLTIQTFSWTLEVLI